MFWLSRARKSRAAALPTAMAVRTSSPMAPSWLWLRASAPSSWSRARWWISAPSPVSTPTIPVPSPPCSAAGWPRILMISLPRWASALPLAARKPPTSGSTTSTPRNCPATNTAPPARCRSGWWTSGPASTWTSASGALASTATASPTPSCFTPMSAAMWKTPISVRRWTASSRPSC